MGTSSDHTLGPAEQGQLSGPGTPGPCTAYPQGGAVAATASKQVSCKWQTLINAQLIIDSHVPSF